MGLMRNTKREDDPRFAEYDADSWEWSRNRDKGQMMKNNMRKPVKGNLPLGGEFDERMRLYQEREREVAENNNPVNVWKRQIDNMMASGNTLLQKQARSMIGDYQKRATANQEGSVTGDWKKYGRAQGQGYEGSFMDFMKEMRAPGVTVNTGSNMPTVSDLKSMEWLDPEKNKAKEPMIGNTWDDLKGKVRVRSEAERQETTKKQNATNILNEVESMLFDDKEGIYNTFGSSEDAGIAGKFNDMLTANAEYFLQRDPRFKNYTDYVEGTLSSLVKSLGEVGNLAAEDVARARALIPSLFGPKVDRADVAREKLNKLRRLINLKDQGKLNTESFNEAIQDEQKPWTTESGPVPGVFWAEEE